MSQLLSVIDRIAEHTPQPFIAPIPDLERVQLFTLQDGIPYWFTVRNQPGWWRVIPTTKSKARLDRLAWPYEYLPYLEQLPRFYVFALYPLSRWTWLCVPANSADAAQRGWPNGEPRPMHLTRWLNYDPDGHVPAVARMMGDVLLFDNYSPQRDIRWPGSDVVNAINMFNAHRAQLRHRAEERQREQRLATVEGQMEYMLSLSGAKLNDWTVTGSGYRVTWSHGGRSHEMVLNRNMTIRSAGVCLDGTDQTHDLASIVQVMMER